MGESFTPHKQRAKQRNSTSTASSFYLLSLCHLKDGAPPPPSSLPPPPRYTSACPQYERTHCELQIILLFIYTKRRRPTHRKRETHTQTQVINKCSLLLCIFKFPLLPHLSLSVFLPLPFSLFYTRRRRRRRRRRLPSFFLSLLLVSVSLRRPAQ